MRHFENLVRDILASRRMTHHFQPIWDTSERTLLGFEALARFPDAPPELVFRAAEACHMGVALDRLSIQEALRQAHNLPGLLFMNINPNHLGQSEGPFGSVGSAIATRRHRQAVVFEITEEKVQEQSQVEVGVARMHRRHIKLALDDAGTGKSDASRLKWVRPRYVKIAQPLLQRWESGAPEALLRWIRLARTVDAELIAEGVEDAALIEPLRELGIRYLQGFALGRPEPSEYWQDGLQQLEHRQLETALSVFYPPEWQKDLAANPPLLSVQEIGDIMYSLWPVPAFIVDGNNRLVGMNLRAERFFGTSLEHVALQPAEEVLGLTADEPGLTRVSPILPGNLPIGESIEQRVRLARGDAGAEPARLTMVGVRVGMRPATYKLVTLITEASDSSLTTFLGRDPLSGLPTRAWWEQEQRAWHEAHGAVIFLDLDGLKQVNDLFGHGEGDRLIADMGRIIRYAVENRARAAVRYGGDEFLIVLKHANLDEAENLAKSLAQQFSTYENTASRVPSSVSYGVSTFHRGALSAAIHAADQRLYEQKGLLLPTSSGAKLVLTANGRRALWQPIQQRRASRLGLDRLVQHVPATHLRRAFVDFIAPATGSAVVEVNAGRGQVGFIGQLVARLGPDAQYLGADSNGQYLTRIHQQWQQQMPATRVHFLRTAADHLPIVSQSADLTVLGWSLPPEDAEVVLKEMARITRADGMVALAMVQSARFSDDLERLWHRMDRPVPVLEESELLAIARRLNLTPLRTHQTAETLIFPTVKEVSLWLAALDVKAHQYLDLTEPAHFDQKLDFEVTVETQFWLFVHNPD